MSISSSLWCAAVLLSARALLIAPACATQVYTDVTETMGIHVPGLGSGAAWSDFDGDGDLDLLVSDSTYPYHIYLFRNDGDVFSDVTATSTISGQGRNFAVGDYDNDGREDVAIISLGYPETRLFRNVGGMVFEDVSAPAGISGTYMRRCSWIDYDRNGFLDLYTVGPSGSQLFRSLGDGTFEDLTGPAGVSAGGNSCAWLDYDRDGYADCYVGRGGANSLYRNFGDGTFTDVAAAAGVDDAYGTSGVCAGDYDGDGWFDLYSVNIGSPSNRLYRNRGDGSFEEVTSVAGVGDVGDGRTATFVDIDYDGRIDLFSSNHVYPNRLYRNNGDDTFTDIASALNIASPSDPFGTAFGDFDNDGDLDVFLATHFGNRLLRCDGMPNHWIQVHLTGTVSNRSAIGALVKCESGGRTAWMCVDGGHGMGDSDSPTLEFGLGGVAQPVEIEIDWPTGAVETWPDLSPDVRVDLIEGGAAGSAEPVEPSPHWEESVVLDVAPNPADTSCTVRFQTGDQGVRSAELMLFDASGRLVRAASLQPEGDITTGTFELRGLPAGSYWLHLSAGGKVTTRRLIKLDGRP